MSIWVLLTSPSWRYGKFGKSNPARISCFLLIQSDLSKFGETPVLWARNSYGNLKKIFFISHNLLRWLLNSSKPLQIRNKVKVNLDSLTNCHVILKSLVLTSQNHWTNPLNPLVSLSDLSTSHSYHYRNRKPLRNENRKEIGGGARDYLLVCCTGFPRYLWRLRSIKNLNIRLPRPWKLIIIARHW